MKEILNRITLLGKPMTLLGNELKEGDRAPNFSAVANDMTPFHFASLRGKICVILSVPSLDTPVCDIETRRFNKEATVLAPTVELLAVSMDLPFAQKRWCGAAGVTRIRTVSDYQKAAFGKAYGVLIKEVRLLARAIFIVDKEGRLRYRELVREVTQEPDYDTVLRAIAKLT
jgi:thiol peroxidase